MGIPKFSPQTSVCFTVFSFKGDHVLFEEFHHKYLSTYPLGSGHVIFSSSQEVTLLATTLLNSSVQPANPAH